MLLFAGGPVWAMEWCPTPESAVASQYVALACHRGMDDQHYVNETYPGPGLVQLWDVGQLESDRRSCSSAPAPLNQHNISVLFAAAKCFAFAAFAKSIR